MHASLSAHAAVRMKQRGVPPQVFDLLMQYGDGVHDHRGAEIVHFTPRSRRSIERSAGPAALRLVERHRRVYAVVTLDGTVATVGHRTKRIAR